jgi:hypothetical protein
MLWTFDKHLLLFRWSRDPYVAVSRDPSQLKGPQSAGQARDAHAVKDNNNNNNNNNKCTTAGKNDPH